jgi:hypothetical protein
MGTAPSRRPGRAGTIGIFANEDPDQNPDVLHRLAWAIGGEVFFPHSIRRVSGTAYGRARQAYEPWQPL